MCALVFMYLWTYASESQDIFESEMLRSLHNSGSTHVQLAWCARLRRLTIASVIRCNIEPSLIPLWLSFITDVFMHLCRIALASAR